MSRVRPSTHHDGGLGPRAWLLNLDAELELRKPHRYQPTHATLAACRSFEAQARALLCRDDIVIDRASISRPMTAQGYHGVAWCPTPSALAFLTRSGAALPVAPALSCLQEVNNRRFHANLGQTLPGARFVATLTEARELLATSPPNGWMVKRGFGFANRGNRRFPSAPAPDDWRWLDHALADGGVQVEPWLPIELEFSLHGHLGADGKLRLGTPCARKPADSYCYVIAHGEYALSPSESSALLAQGEGVGRALRGAGYFGPFGIDAFRYRCARGVAFNPRSEINARYTLAYALGMGHPAG